MATDLVSVHIDLTAAGVENNFKPHRSSGDYLMTPANFGRLQKAVLEALMSLAEPAE